MARVETRIKPEGSEKGHPAEVFNGVYDSSCISAFQRCPRHFYYRYALRLVPPVVSTALTFGSTMHEALEKADRGAGEEEVLAVWDTYDPCDDTRRTREHGKLITKEYLDYYSQDPITTLDDYIEIEFMLSFVDGTFLAGRLDKLVEYEGGIWVMDHKTASSVGKNFYEDARPRLQFDVYCWACRELVGECRGIIVDGISTAGNPKQRFGRCISPRTDRELDERITETGKVVRDIHTRMDGLIPANAMDYASRFPMHTAYGCSLYYGCIYKPFCIYGYSKDLERVHFIKESLT